MLSTKMGCSCFDRRIRTTAFAAGTSPLELGLYTPPRAPTLSDVPEILTEARRVGPYPTALANKVLLHSDLQTAIARSQGYLLSLQKPEAYWVGELMTDSTLCSDMIAYCQWEGKVDMEWQRKAVHHIFSMQLPDGG